MKRFFLMMILMMVFAASNIVAQDIIVSSYPVKLILQEITGKAVDIDVVVPFGADPFDVKGFNQNYLRGSEIADAFVYISDEFEPWAKNVKAKKKIALFDFVPTEMLIDKEGNLAFTDKVLEKLNEAITKNANMKMSKPRSSVIQKALKGKKLCPYFWHDPLVVQAILPSINTALAEVMPEQAGNFTQNTTRFSARVTGVNIELREILKIAKYQSFCQLTPAFNYFAAQYKLYNTKPISSVLNITEPQFAVFSYHQTKSLSGVDVESKALKLLADNKFPVIFYSRYDYSEAADIIRKSDTLSSAELGLFYGRSSNERYFDLLYENAAIIQKVYLPVKKVKVKK